MVNDARLPLSADSNPTLTSRVRETSRWFKDMSFRLGPIVVVWIALFLVICLRSSGTTFDAELMMGFSAIGIAMAAATIFFGQSGRLRIPQVVFLTAFASLHMLFFMGIVGYYFAGGWGMQGFEMVLLPFYVGLSTMVAVIPFWMARRFLGWRVIDAKEEFQTHIEKPKFDLKDSMIWCVYVAVLFTISRALNNGRVDPTAWYMSALTGIIMPATGLLLLTWLAEQYPIYKQFAYLLLGALMASFAAAIVSFGMGAESYEVFSSTLRRSVIGGTMWLLILRYLTSRGLVISASPNDPNRLQRIRDRYCRSLSFRMAFGKKLNGLIHWLLTRRNDRLQREFANVDALSKKALQIEEEAKTKTTSSP